MKRSSIFAVIAILCLLIGPAEGQDKSKKLAPTDTLVSRTKMIAKIRSDMEQVRTEAENTLLILRGQLSALEMQTTDSIRVKK